MSARIFLALLAFCGYIQVSPAFYLHCVNHECYHESKCEILITNGHLHGTCVKNHDKEDCSHYHYTPPNNKPCLCPNNNCIKEVVKNLVGYDNGELQCLSEKCGGTLPVCAISRHNGHLTSRCAYYFVNFCKDFNYHVPNNHACRCTTNDCINKTVRNYIGSLHCVNTTCPDSRPVCELINIGGHIKGECQSQYTNLCENRYTLANHHKCRCNSSTCIDKVLKANRVMECLSHTCHGENVCYLYTNDATSDAPKISAKCIDGPGSHRFCENHDAIINGGCFCNSSQCISNSAIHHNGVACSIVQAMSLHYFDGRFHTHCHSDTRNLPVCDVNRYNPYMGRCFCSTQSCVDVMTTLTTTQSTIPTSTVIAPTVTTTHAATAKHTATTKPTTIRSTITIPTTTMLPTTTNSSSSEGNQTACHKCGEFPIPCSLDEVNGDNIAPCSIGQDFCMTDIIRDKYGNLDIFKRCANKATCDKEWLNGSSKLDYCKNYGDVQGPAAFQCHICCIGDGCNEHIVPNVTTWYGVTQ